MRPHAAALAVLFAVLACARGLPPVVTPPLPDAVPPVTDEASAEPAAAEEAVGPAPAAPPAAESMAPAGSGRERIPSRVRVGLATDLEELLLPCCETRLALYAAGKRLELSAGVRIAPVSGGLVPPSFRVQVAALRAERQAAALARHLTEVAKTGSEVVFDAGAGLYRVRLGPYPSRVEAEAEIGRLRRRGVEGAWVVSERPTLEDPALRVVQGERQWVLPGRTLEVRAADGGASGIPFDRKYYRGALVVYLNDRGSLNLINRLSVDDYLRGVVPREMGPELYDDLEALKAQAVAARTYTLRNLGEFRAEGYDICATPRCQVYGGIASEHPLSDRAVRETSGQVLLAEGRFADTLYSSTCGGHTENVEVVFPSKRHAYLRGVACLEAGAAELAGATPDAVVEAAVLDRLLPAAAGSDLEVFVHRSRRLVAAAGLETAAAAPPRSAARREVHAYLGRLLDLAPAAGLKTPATVQPAGWSAEEARLAGRLHETGLMEQRSSASLEAAELRRVLFRLAIYLRRVERFDGGFLSLEGGELRVKGRAAEYRWPLAADVATFAAAAAAGGDMRPAALTLVAGDAVSVYVADGRPLVLAQRREPVASGLDRPSRHQSWRYFRSDRELAERVNQRYPGLGFRHLEVVSRGVSGRVATLRLTGEDGEQVDLDGLPVRWLLDLPDTLFTAERVPSRGGEPGWLFSGRGWGHGVGMCQVGAFGMARRGHRYQDILDHYYTGLELRKLATDGEPAPAP